MKQSFNRNTLWTELFVSALENLGIKHACISPGSRNTPLTIAFQKSKRIKSFVHVDERSSGFFALGLASKTNKPIVLVTTSGTAVIELYPAIVEAYQQKIPLLVCTADRPSYLLNTGANQTINQINVFENNIVNSYSLELPALTQSKLNELFKVTKEAFKGSAQKMGPVHINFPFDFPFEPSNKTDVIESIALKEIRRKFKTISVSQKKTKSKQDDIKFLFDRIKISKRRIILVGPGRFNKEKTKNIIRFAKNTNSLIFADGLSGARFHNQAPNILLANHVSFIRSKVVRNQLDPDLIIQIGAAPTSNSILDFFKNSSAYKILVNEFGELKDPSRTTNRIITAEYNELFEALNMKLYKNENIKTDQKWFFDLTRIDELTEEIKFSQFNKLTFPFEGKIINKVIEIAPKKSNIMISNSLPARDIDALSSKANKSLNIFSNRGASGIDGIISSASGISAGDLNHTFLVIGDLAFYHDITGLLPLKKYSLPLIIILLNNDGGGIFELLPISKEGIDFKNYFKTPLGIDFKDIVLGFRGNYTLVNGWDEFENQIKKSVRRKTFSVIEIKIDSKRTLKIRKRIWSEIKNSVDRYLNEN